MNPPKEVSLVFQEDELPILADALRRRFTQVKRDRVKVVSMAAHVKIVIDLLAGDEE